MGDGVRLYRYGDMRVGYGLKCCLVRDAHLSKES